MLISDPTLQRGAASLPLARVEDEQLRLAARGGVSFVFSLRVEFQEEVVQEVVPVAGQADVSGGGRVVRSPSCRALMRLLWPSAWPRDSWRMLRPRTAWPSASLNRHGSVSIRIGKGMIPPLADVS